MATIAPPLHRGMVKLERSAFNKVVEMLAIKVPTKKVGVVMKDFSKDLFNQPRLRNVEPDPESKDSKLVLLRLDLESIGDLSQDKLDEIRKNGFEVVKHHIELDYDYWTTEQILHAVIPENLTDVPSSFTQIGHIAHMNLREAYYPWKHLIGQVILDKNKNITTVVNKTDNIDTTFRFFKMEVLAGEDNMIAEVRENGCRFKFDFSKVYWNSRLHTEHERLIELFQPKEYICDVFAGVGPFALPAAKKGSIVYANDLNPNSYEWMKTNIKANKITSGIYPYNLDGRAFIRQAVKDLQALDTSKWKTFDHFVMNLPATAIEFLDTFRGLYHDKKELFDNTENAKLPMIHCHCFTRSSNATEDILERVSQAMKGSRPDPLKTTLHWVRNVAPKKDMYCISFPLSSEIAFASPTTINK
ncbi:guanine(37)-N1-methyltransferase [Cokeromyces recurvatus]|uniref:guanine(37)-N1-methyltransferase n=1 Tax=Cokeromyces recurvatus TaxID=90255 RepID=UPI00221FBD65|nr:guanine(37)-N1-methyltransferase [Cokeromyces recurvatus]KAI7905055.1 guanine(37)-N1-methyltransferase [Cokeromyces recurvatus]